jgi:ABC-type uncharacterized transport system ATPase subunit
VSESAAADAPIVLEMQSVTKRFGPVTANDDVSLVLHRGEILGLLGENGAGKSTLMKILYGLYTPDEGEIFVHDEKVEIHDPKDAVSRGIGMVHQHFTLIPPLTVAENIVLGAEPRGGALGVSLDTQKAVRATEELSERYGLKVDPRARVADLSVGIRQRVEILKALYRDVRILVLDEPTAGLEVRGGEILRIAGVDGNGQTELAEALAGTRHAEGGTVHLDGEDVTHLSADARQERGLAYVPEDRATTGLVQDFALYENNTLKRYDERPFSRFGVIFPKVMRRRAAESLRAYDVRPPDPDARAGSLSGGNQQKAVLARELSGDPGVLIAAQPTRGVDVGAIEFIHRQILEQRSEGKAILLISLELEEVRSLSDRILVLYAGRIVGELGPDATDEELGLLMAGRTAEEKSA